MDDGSPPPNVVRVCTNGPLELRGELWMNGARLGDHVRLCRCGASRTKPLCDGRHVAVGFVARGEPAAGEIAELAARGGPLVVDPRPRGALKLTGNLEVHGESGRLVRRTERVLLCRCGASENEPYCDGSHNRIGFVTE